MTDDLIMNKKTSCAPTHNNNQKRKAGQRKKKTNRVLRMAGSKGGRLKKGEEVVLDLEDESNRAFHLIRKKHNFLTYRTNPFSFPCHHLPHLSPPPNCPSSSQTTGIQPWSTYHPGTPVHQCQYHLPIPLRKGEKTVIERLCEYRGYGDGPCPWEHGYLPVSFFQVHHSSS
mmetsp:Transcript_15906/g.25710  ORF Transcript_15906/g.25710 Transcript_15906/m.25710 type:complete len:171 (+) Transcript_15906:366-878(+)